MITFFNSWVSGIVVAVIVGSIIEMLLPEGNNKKYVKIVIGVFILFTIISPIITKFSSGIDMNLIKYNDYLNTIPVESVNVINDNDIIKVYEKNISENIKNTVENKGYIVNKIDVVASNNNEKYAEIKKVILRISKTKENIENIRINLSDKNNKKNELNMYEEDEIKEIINSTYGVDKNNIFIN